MTQKIIVWAMYIFIQPLHNEEDISQDFFLKWSTAGLNSDSSVSSTGCHIELMTKQNQGEKM